MVKKVWIFFICVSISLNAFAAVTVRLKNGRKVEGALVRIDEKKITIAVASDSGQIKTSLAKEEIDSIEGFSFDEFLRKQQTYEVIHYEGKEKGLQASFEDAKKLVEEKRKLSFISEVKKRFSHAISSKST